MRHAVERAASRAADRLVAAVERRRTIARQTAPGVKIAQRQLLVTYRNLVAQGATLPSVWDAGFRVFSQVDEDGVILFLLGAVGIGTARFVDIGGGDGLWASNSANLAFNLGFHGLIIDADAEQIARGRSAYLKHPDTRLYPPAFQHAQVTQANVNELLRTHGFEGDVDLLSIDIDGNDYWIWEAVEAISPRIVVIEIHTEHGLAEVLMPYDASHLWRANAGPRQLGASATAMTQLAERLGYRLVGANRFGFNAFYLRHDLGQGAAPTIEVDALFRHTWTKL
jgi:hypothetical protein